MVFFRILAGSILLLSLQDAQRGEPSPPSDFPASDARILDVQRMGLARARALRPPQASPDSPETVGLLLRSSEIKEALALARRIVETRPEHLVATLRILAEWLNEGDAPEIVAAARARLPSLPREDAATVARMLAGATLRSGQISESARIAELQDFVRTYDGTREAQQARVTLIALLNRDSTTRFAELEAFAGRHPRTVEAARALYTKAFDLHVNVVMRGEEPNGSDPTERFMKVLAIANELEYGAYPPCEWVDKAPDLVVEFFATDAIYSPANRDRMIEALTQFVGRHFTLHDGEATEWSAGYLVAHKIADLFELKGERIAGVERTLARLEQDTADAAAVRYLSALFYRREAQMTREDKGGPLRTKARAALRDLAKSGGGQYQRKALASLAALHFAEGDYRIARGYFTEFIDRYPESDWGWVAALRIGQTHEALEDLGAAVASYRATAARYASIPQARVLGHVHAARVLERMGTFDQAEAEYQAALAGWDSGYGTQYSSYWSAEPAEPGPISGLPTDRGVAYLEDLPSRIAQLRRSNATPGGALAERGRWLLERQRWTEAQVALREMIATYPKSRGIGEARELLHRARLEAALEPAGAGRPGVDDTKTLDALAAIAREPYTFGVSAAKIARATILWQRGAASDASALMTAALQEWHTRRSPSPGTAPTPLERDIAAIQDLVFRPKGDGVFKGTEWEGEPFSGGDAPFVVVNTDIRVTFAGGAVQRVTSAHVPAASRGGVLLIDNAEQATLARIITKLGGTGTTENVATMEVPNQPDRRSRNVMDFWRGFFQMRPGHWGGWMFQTNPIISGIEFGDAARTTAFAEVAIGYEGGVVALEKKNGVWKALGIGGRSIQ